MYHSVESAPMISRKNDPILFFLLTFLYVSFYLPMGSSIPTLVLLGYLIIKDRLETTLKISSFVIYCFSFVLFCYLSCFWAKDTYYVFLQTNHILKSVFGIIVVYMCVQKKPSVDVMLKAMMWGGYVVLFYMIAFYGISGLIGMLNESERMTNDVMNANLFAMCIAYSCVIHVFFGLKERWSVWHLLIVPALLLLAVSGSRKGLIILVGGILCVVTLTIWQKERSVKAILKIIFWLTVLCIAIVIILNLPAFKILNERITNFFNLLSGDTNVDNSLLTRSNFIDIGLSIFKEHPLLGVGIDNARLYNYRNVYLHNNFIELLADGGIIGFVTYYSMYIYLFIQYIKNRKTANKYYSICLVLLIFMTAMHYAFVSYKVSGEYYMLLVCYLQLEQFGGNRNYNENLLRKINTD